MELAELADQGRHRRRCARAGRPDRRGGRRACRARGGTRRRSGPLKTTRSTTARRPGSCDLARRGARGSPRAPRPSGRRRAGTRRVEARPARGGARRRARRPARPGSARPCRARRPRRRARTAGRSGRPRGTPAPRSCRCGRAARAPGRRSRSGRSAGPCARTRSAPRTAGPGAARRPACRRRRSRRPRGFHCVDLDRAARTAPARTRTVRAGSHAIGSNAWTRLIWEGEPPELRSPVLVAAFAGWNDAASAATTALEAVAGVARRRGGRRDRPGGVLRLPGHPADDPADRGAGPPDRLARRTRCSPPRRRAPSATWCCSAGPSRTCAGAPSPTRSSTPPSAAASRWWSRSAR